MTSQIAVITTVTMPAQGRLAQIVLSFVSIMQADDWMGLELRHLLALKAIAEEGSFGRAAKRLGYTQSAISQQVAVLERIVGQRLVDRPGGPRPVSITEAGELLLTHADGIMARLRAARADLSALGAGDAGPLRIGTYQSVGARVLPALLRSFRADWPKIDVTLVESADDRELLALVESGEVDLSFVVFPLRPGPFESRELMRDPYVLLVPKDSPLAKRDRVPSLREIVELPLIGYRSCRTTQQVEERLRVAGREPHVVFRSDDNYTVQGMVAAGIGVALVPALTVDPSEDRIVVVELGDRVPARLIGIAWHRDRLRTSAAGAFVDAAQALCEDFENAAGRLTNRNTRSTEHVGEGCAITKRHSSRDRSADRAAGATSSRPERAARCGSHRRAREPRGRDREAVGRAPDRASAHPLRRA